MVYKIKIHNGKLQMLKPINAYLLSFTKSYARQGKSFFVMVDNVKWLV